MSVHILQFQITKPVINYTLQSPNLGLLKIDKNLPTGHALIITIIVDNAIQIKF